MNKSKKLQFDSPAGQAVVAKMIFTLDDREALRSVRGVYTLARHVGSCLRQILPLLYRKDLAQCMPRVHQALEMLGCDMMHWRACAHSTLFASRLSYHEALLCDRLNLALRHGRDLAPLKGAHRASVLEWLRANNTSDVMMAVRVLGYSTPIGHPSEAPPADAAGQFMKLPLATRLRYVVKTLDELCDHKGQVDQKSATGRILPGVLEQVDRTKTRFTQGDLDGK